MLWRVRTTLADRPGSLAALARHCGDQSVNILGLQIFPGVEGVTDELVLASPDGWTLSGVAELVESAGGTEVSVGACNEHALVDGPTRYLNAVRRVLHGADTPEEALAGLLDAEPASDPAPTVRLALVQHSLEVELGGRCRSLRRTAAFTATEHARAAAFAETVGDLDEAAPVGPAPVRAVERERSGGDEVQVRAASYSDSDALMAMHGRCSHDTVYRHYGAPLPRLDHRLARRMLLGEGGALVAVADGAVVGLATMSEMVDARCDVALLVEDRWQRRGIGTRLLGTAVRHAAAEGAHDVVLRGPSESPAAIAMVFGSGLRARAKLTDDQLVLTISTRGMPRGHSLRPVRGVSLHS